MQPSQLLLFLSLAGSVLASYRERPLRRRDNTTAPAPEDSKPILNQYIIEFAEVNNWKHRISVLFSH